MKKIKRNMKKIIKKNEIIRKKFKKKKITGKNLN